MQLEQYVKNILIILLLLVTSTSFAFGGNTNNDNYGKSIYLLLDKVYSDLPKETIYCGAKFESKAITNPNGFSSPKYKGRSQRVEWEHVVPEENFGRAFPEWRTGHKDCKRKGRSCAIKKSREFRLMYSDMYNLFPAIGSVNALRSNYNCSEGLGDNSSLGGCDMKIKARKAEPPNSVKGIIARTYLYMDKVYTKYRIGSSNKKMFKAWNKMYPVTDFECKRAKKIQSIQHNRNAIVKSSCVADGLW